MENLSSGKNLSNDWSRLTVSNNLDYLPVILNYVGTIAEHVGFNSEERKRIELATEEVATNVIEHAFTPDEVGTFDIICQRAPNGLQITVHDNGIPYNPTTGESYDPNKDIDNQTSEGLGGFLIRGFMDEYQFCNLGPEGKETRLVKFFNSDKIIYKDLPAPEPEIPKPSVPQVTEKIDFSIRLMKPEEAIEVAKCIYDSYGYSYANEHVYYPERIVAFNESGTIRSAVAVTNTDEMAGHFALLFYDYLPTEIGIAVTKKELRGQGLARYLGEFLVEEAIRMGLKGVHVKGVTVHPYTQKFSQKLGYKDCGFLLAHSPKTLSFKGIADELSQRNSDVVGFKYLQKAELKDLYLPERHSEMILKLFANLDTPVKMAAPTSSLPLNNQTVMNASINSMRSLGEIRISQYGKDIIMSFRRELHRLRKEEVHVIEMFLSLTDPMTPVFVPEIEKLGFFFTGIMPETEGGDSMILQYLNGVQIEYEELTIVSDMANELLTYIQGNDPYYT